MKRTFSKSVVFLIRSIASLIRTCSPPYNCRQFLAVNKYCSIVSFRWTLIICVIADYFSASEIVKKVFSIIAERADMTSCRIRPHSSLEYLFHFFAKKWHWFWKDSLFSGIKKIELGKRVNNFFRNELNRQNDAFCCYGYLYDDIFINTFCFMWKLWFELTMALLG